MNTGPFCGPFNGWFHSGLRVSYIRPSTSLLALLSSSISFPRLRQSALKSFSTLSNIPLNQHIMQSSSPTMPHAKTPMYHTAPSSTPAWIESLKRIHAIKTAEHYPGTPIYYHYQHLQASIDAEWQSFLRASVLKDLRNGSAKAKTQRKVFWEEKECLLVYELAVPQSEKERHEWIAKLERGDMDILARTASHAQTIITEMFSSKIEFKHVRWFPDLIVRIPSGLPNLPTEPRIDSLMLSCLLTYQGTSKSALINESRPFAVRVPPSSYKTRWTPTNSPAGSTVSSLPSIYSASPATSSSLSLPSSEFGEPASSSSSVSSAYPADTCAKEALEDMDTAPKMEQGLQLIACA